MNTPEPQLSIVQRWFQSVITHPDGVDAGATPGEIEDTITPSARLTAKERIAIYAHAFHARLIDCLGESFSILKRTLGEEAFSGFAFGYLQAYPSRSYTINDLGANFARYLGESRPARDSDRSEPDWADFLIELAKLEWTIEQVFDGPGTEGIATLGAQQLRSIPASRRPGLRLRTAPCLKLLEFRFPANAYFTAMRRAEDAVVDAPSPEPTWLAINRRDFIVRRAEITRAQYVILSELQSGATIEAAIRAASEWLPASDQRLLSELRAWFEEWSAMGLFVEVSDRR